MNTHKVKQKKKEITHVKKIKKDRKINDKEVVDYIIQQWFGRRRNTKNNVEKGIGLHKYDISLIKYKDISS